MLRAVKSEGDVVKAICSCGQQHNVPKTTDVDGLMTCDISCACGRTHVSCMIPEMQHTSLQDLEAKEQKAIIKAFEGDILLKAEARAQRVSTVKTVLYATLVAAVVMTFRGCAVSWVDPEAESSMFWGIGLLIASVYAISKLETFFELEPSRAQVRTIYQQKMGVEYNSTKTTYFCGFKPIDEDIPARKLSTLQKPTPLLVWKADGQLRMVYDPEPHILNAERYKLYKGLAPFCLAQDEIIFYDYYGDIKVKYRDAKFDMVGGLLGGIFVGGNLGVALGGGLFDKEAYLDDERNVVLIYRTNSGQTGAIFFTKDIMDHLVGWFPEKERGAVEAMLNEAAATVSEARRNLRN